jgi:hypothetical protein
MRLGSRIGKPEARQRPSARIIVWIARDTDESSVVSHNGQAKDLTDPILSDY